MARCAKLMKDHGQHLVKLIQCVHDKVLDPHQDDWHGFAYLDMFFDATGGLSQISRAEARSPIKQRDRVPLLRLLDSKDREIIKALNWYPLWKVVKEQYDGLSDLYTMFEKALLEKVDRKPLKVTRMSTNTHDPEDSSNDDFYVLRITLKVGDEDLPQEESEKTGP